MGTPKKHSDVSHGESGDNGRTGDLAVGGIAHREPFGERDKKRRLLTLVLVNRNPENFTRPKQDGAISVLVGMLISVRAPHRAGGSDISGVDVIVCSCV
jgi:hypothetical protein